MGGTDEFELLRMIGFDPMPVTRMQLEEKPQIDRTVVYHVVESHVGYHWAIKDEGKYWVTDDVMIKAIAKAEENIQFWQKRIEYLKSQQKTLAARKQQMGSGEFSNLPGNRV